MTRRTRCTYPIVEIPWCSFSTLNIQNSRRRYIGILMQTYWKYSSHLRRKFGEGKYLLYISTRKTFRYISFSHFYIVVANYKYLLGGGGTSCFDSTYASEKRIDREKFNKRFLKFKHSPALDYKLDIVHPLS